MGIVKKDISLLKDVNGLLGKALLEPNITTRIFKVKDKARYCNCNINITNASGAQAHVKFYISYRDTPELEDLVESNIVLEPDAVYVRTNMVLGGNETIYILSDVGNVICRVEGFEDNLL